MKSLSAKDAKYGPGLPIASARAEPVGTAEHAGEHQFQIADCFLERCQILCRAGGRPVSTERVSTSCARANCCAAA